MVDLETEVSLATLQLYLEKAPEKRSPRLRKLARESLTILQTKEEQMTAQDKALYVEALGELT